MQAHTRSGRSPEGPRWAGLLSSGTQATPRTPARWFTPPKSTVPNVGRVKQVQQVFGGGELGGLVAYYHENGFAVVRGAVEQTLLEELERQCTDAQRRLAAGELDRRFGTTELVDEAEPAREPGFANYVLHATELSSAARAITRSGAILDVVRAILGDDCWPGEGDLFGFVYQDARPSATSRYRRIGWHSDWQSGPHLALWPSTAVTVNIDGTGPANGYLRVVPGSHMWATPAPYENVNGAVVPPGAADAGGYTDQPPPFPMPLRFEDVPGEVAVLADPGDVFFHDCYLWHAAAMAADPAARRRHVRGSWYGGTRPERYDEGDFVKNAAR